MIINNKKAQGNASYLLTAWTCNTEGTEKVGEAVGTDIAWVFAAATCWTAALAETSWI